MQAPALLLSKKHIVSLSISNEISMIYSQHKKKTEFGICIMQTLRFQKTVFSILDILLIIDVIHIYQENKILLKVIQIVSNFHD